MKYFKNILKGIICLPVVLILLFVLFEIFGMCINHISTGIQTSKLKHNLTEAIDNIKIIDTKSETGNTSGTGNHVDSLSEVIFSTNLSLNDVQKKMDEYYDYDMWQCYIEETENADEYKFFLLTSAPFSDNIEGH